MTPDERLEAVAQALHREYPLTVKSLHVARELADCALCSMLDDPSRTGPPDPVEEKNEICGTVCAAGPNLEPLACAYKKGHGGDHSWATLPTFLASEVAGEVPAGRAFLAASVAVWRHLDEHGRCPGGGAGSPEWEEGKRLRVVEKAAWERYRSTIDWCPPELTDSYESGDEVPAGLTREEAEALAADFRKEAEANLELSRHYIDDKVLGTQYDSTARAFGQAARRVEAALRGPGDGQEGHGS